MTNIPLALRSEIEAVEHYIMYGTTDEWRAARAALCAKVGALCVECGREAVETYCRDELLDDTYETIARRLVVRGKDG